MEIRDADSGVGAGKPLDATDFANGNKIDVEVPEGQNPIQDAIDNGDGYEGDIHLNNEQAAIIANGTEEERSALRAATTTSYHKWPKSGSTVSVPYEISSSFSSSERAVIARAFSDYQSNTCIRYVFCIL